MWKIVQMFPGKAEMEIKKELMNTSLLGTVLPWKIKILSFLKRKHIFQELKNSNLGAVHKSRNTERGGRGFTKLCKNTPYSCNIGWKSLAGFFASYVTALWGIYSLKNSWVYSFITWALFGTSFIKILILVYNFNLHFFSLFLWNWAFCGIFDWFWPPFWGTAPECW